jgi:ribosomal-protein-alanine N-acetyltransferase
MRTGDVELTDFTEVDISEKYLSWLNNPQHMKFSTQRFVEHTHDSAIKYLKGFEGTPNRFFAIRVDGKLVGSATFYVDVNYKTASPGILIAPEHVGKGFGKRAWDLLVFDLPTQLGIRKVSAGTLESNLAMIKLFESSKMEFEARLIGEGIFNELPTDILIYRKFLS